MTSLPPSHIEAARLGGRVLRDVVEPAAQFGGLPQTNNDAAGGFTKGGHAHGKGEYPVHTPNVFGRHQRIGQMALRVAVAKDLAELKSLEGLTDDQIGKDADCCGPTIANAINQRTDMKYITLLQLAKRRGGRVLDRSLAMAGLRAVPMEAKCDTDRRCGSAVSRLAYSISCALEDDDEINDDELMEEVGPALESAGAKIDALRERYRMLKLIRALRSEQAA